MRRVTSAPAEGERAVQAALNTRLIHNRECFRVSGFGFQVSGFGFRFSGFGFQVSSFRFRVSGFEFQISGSGCWPSNFWRRISVFGVGAYRVIESVGELVPHDAANPAKVAFLQRVDIWESTPHLRASATFGDHCHI